MAAVGQAIGSSGTGRRALVVTLPLALLSGVAAIAGASVAFSPPAPAAVSADPGAAPTSTATTAPTTTVTTAPSTTTTTPSQPADKPVPADALVPADAPPALDDDALAPAEEPPAPASPPPLPGNLGSAEAARAWDLLNALRSAQGLPALAPSGDAVAKAQALAERVAANGQLAHSPSPFADLDGRWMTVLENLGLGASVDEVHDLLATSAPHRRNMLDSSVSAGGVGVAIGLDGAVYITQILVG